MNRARGESVLMIDGKPNIVCLTLGALAELEEMFGCASLADLQTRLKRLSASELKQVLSVLVVGDVAAGLLERVRPAEAARTIAEAFHAALG